MLEEIVAIDPVHFISLNLDCHFFKGKKADFLPCHYRLPDLSDLNGGSSFAKVALAWSELGLFASIESSLAIGEVFYPSINEGTAVELFIDTRDVKGTRYNHRFSHHFFFLPQAVGVNGESVQAGELTRFRGEESHPLADPLLLEVVVKQKLRGYQMGIFIPKEALFSFSPLECDKIGFTYRLSRPYSDPQYFSVSDRDFAFETQPSLWASIKLVE